MAATAALVQRDEQREGVVLTYSPSTLTCACSRQAISLWGDILQIHNRMGCALCKCIPCFGPSTSTTAFSTQAVTSITLNVMSLVRWIFGCNWCFARASLDLGTSARSRVPAHLSSFPLSNARDARELRYALLSHMYAHRGKLLQAQSPDDDALFEVDIASSRCCRRTRTRFGESHMEVKNTLVGVPDCCISWTSTLTMVDNIQWMSMYPGSKCCPGLATFYGEPAPIYANVGAREADQTEFVEQWLRRRSPGWSWFPAFGEPLFERELSPQGGSRCVLCRTLSKIEIYREVARVRHQKTVLFCLKSYKGQSVVPLNEITHVYSTMAPACNCRCRRRTAIVIGTHPASSNPAAWFGFPFFQPTEIWADGLGEHSDAEHICTTISRAAAYARAGTPLSSLDAMPQSGHQPMGAGGAAAAAGGKGNPAYGSRGV